LQPVVGPFLFSGPNFRLSAFRVHLDPILAWSTRIDMQQRSEELYLATPATRCRYPREEALSAHRYALGLLLWLCTLVFRTVPQRFRIFGKSALIPF